MKKSIPICVVCDYLLSKHDRNGVPINMLKLQKLLFYAQGYSLALRDSPLFDEPIQAWKRGPVVPEVHEKYKSRFSGRKFDRVRIHCEEKDIDNIVPDEIKQLLDKLYDDKSHLTGAELSSLTHKEGPWRLHYNPKQKKNIPQKDLADYILNSPDITLSESEFRALAIF